MYWLTCHVHGMRAVGNVIVKFKLAVNFFLNLTRSYFFHLYPLVVRGVTYLVFCPIEGRSFTISELIIFLEL